MGSSLLGFLPRKTDCSASSVEGLGWPCSHVFCGAVFGFKVSAADEVYDDVDDVIGPSQRKNGVH